MIEAAVLVSVGLALAQAEMRPEAPELRLYRDIVADIGLGIVCYPVGSDGLVLQRSDQMRRNRFREVRTKLISKKGVEPVHAIDGEIDLLNSEIHHSGCPSDSAESRRRSRLLYNLRTLDDQLRKQTR